MDLREITGKGENVSRSKAKLRNLQVSSNIIRKMNIKDDSDLTEKMSYTILVDSRQTRKNRPIGRYSSRWNDYIQMYKKNSMV
jgi:hypothetical protein